VFLRRSPDRFIAPELADPEADASIVCSRRSCVALAEIGGCWIGAGTVWAQLNASKDEVIDAL